MFYSERFKMGTFSQSLNFSYGRSPDDFLQGFTAVASAVLILLAFAGFLNEACRVDLPVGMAPLVFLRGYMVLYVSFDWRMGWISECFRIGEENLPKIDMT